MELTHPSAVMGLILEMRLYVSSETRSALAAAMETSEQLLISRFIAKKRIKAKDRELACKFFGITEEKLNEEFAFVVTRLETMGILVNDKTNAEKDYLARRQETEAIRSALSLDYYPFIKATPKYMAK